MSSWCPAGCDVVALQHLNKLARPVLDEVKVFPSDSADLEHVTEEVASGLKGQTLYREARLLIHVYPGQKLNNEEGF